MLSEDDREFLLKVASMVRGQAVTSEDDVMTRCVQPALAALAKEVQAVSERIGPPADQPEPSEASSPTEPPEEKKPARPDIESAIRGFQDAAAVMVALKSAGKAVHEASEALHQPLMNAQVREMRASGWVYRALRRDAGLPETDE